MASTTESVLDTWRINDRVTTLLVQNIPPAIWAAPLPASPRRTVRGLAAHLHHTRCSWIRGLAMGTGVPVPRRLDPRTVTRSDLVVALTASGEAMLQVLAVGANAGGLFPGIRSAFVWGAWPRNVSLFTAFAISHEAHHRGQLLYIARELGHRFPAKVVSGIWQWSSHFKKARAQEAAGT